MDGLDLEVPHRQLVVVTGVSGSGKSSLAFDTIFREGQRRYLESFSPRARQALGRLHRPDVEAIEGLPPALAVDQGSVVRSPRSTVGTLSGLYDLLRMLFARVGEPEKGEGRNGDGPQLKASLFSFNTPEGACPDCQGLGVRDRVDPDRLVADPSRSLREGALVPTTPTGYIVYSQVTLEVLDQVCRAHGFDVDTPWAKLTAEQRGVVLYGSKALRVPFGKHPLESRLRWKGIPAKPREEGFYRGLVPTIEEIVHRTRNRNALRFVRTTRCASCEGTRLSRAARAVTIGGRTIAEVAGRALAELSEVLGELCQHAARPRVAHAVVDPMLERIEPLEALGLGHLRLDRPSTTLSRGEAQRLRLGTQAVVGLADLLYVLDEPSIGLHSTDIGRLNRVLRHLLDAGSSLLVVEHAQEIIGEADWWVDVGPGPGDGGGKLLFSGPPPWAADTPGADDALLRSSATLAFGGGEPSKGASVRQPVEDAGALWLRGACQNNLQSVEVQLRLAALNVVSGVSGAGKSSLVLEALVPAVQAAVRGEASSPASAGDLEGAGAIDTVIAVDQRPIGRTPRSNPATYTKVFDRIRDRFAAEPTAHERGFGKGHFSMNVAGGRCEGCHGAGLQTVGMHFLGDVEVCCERCGGRRFSPQVLEVRHRDHTIVDVLEMSVSDARELFADVPAIERMLSAMVDLGLGYLRLGQPSTTLSGGEAQRIKLASELGKQARAHGLYVLDEPTSGLHQADVAVLIGALSRLVEAGHTVVVVEHDLDVLRAADWIVDLGPGGGDAGGRVVAMGPPPVIRAEPRSATGRALRRAERGPRRRSAASRAATPSSESGLLTLKKVRTNNLAGIDVAIPKGALTVVTGPSGSGKSSLAMDTIAEMGRTRFAESLPAFVRRLVPEGRRAEVESVSGLSATLAIGPRRIRNSPRSTVGTMTGALDPLRLLFARGGVRHCPRCHAPLAAGGRCPACEFVGLDRLSAAAFSFNHELGACPSCRGLGFVTTCDPDRLISHPELPLAGGAMQAHRSGRFYGDPDGQHMAIIAAVGAEMGIDFGRPWCELTPEAREVALTGTGARTYDVAWRYRRKGRTGVYRWKTVWRGLVAEVDDEYQRKHADRRGEGMRSLMRDLECIDCGGARLAEELRAVTVGGRALPELLALPVVRLREELATLAAIERQGRAEVAATGAAVVEAQRRLAALEQVGLGYLPLHRRAVDLSAGEAGRVRLAGQLNSGLCHVTYLFDEPTRGLHARDTERLVSSLKRLRDEDNTVIVVEHDLRVVEAADHVVELGPEGGERGGRLLFSGTVEQLRAAEDTITGPWLVSPGQAQRTAPRRDLQGGLVVRRPFAKNLRAQQIGLPRGGLVVVSGVSGSGKSTLLFDVIAPSVRAGRAVGCEELSGFFEHFAELCSVDQSPLAAGATSTPATATGVFDAIRSLFARTEGAKARGFKRGRFAFTGNSGGCKRCGGQGRERVEMGFLAPVFTECPACHGRRYDGETLEVRYRGHSIADVLGLTFGQAAELFRESGRLSRSLEVIGRAGLGYLRLGQPASTLSGGEAQRLRLGTELLRTKRERPVLYLLDEPTTGLHAQEVAALLRLLNELVAQGHTVVAIEHDLQVLQAADWLVDLGPEGGDAGGQVIDEGSPEAVARRGQGPTGLALRAAMRLP